MNGNTWKTYGNMLNHAGFKIVHGINMIHDPRFTEWETLFFFVVSWETCDTVCRPHVEAFPCLEEVFGMKIDRAGNRSIGTSPCFS